MACVTPPEAKRQALDAKLNLHPPENPNRESSVGQNVTATGAQVDNAPIHIRRQVDQVNDSVRLDFMSWFKTPSYPPSRRKGLRENLS